MGCWMSSTQPQPNVQQSTSPRTSAFRSCARPDVLAAVRRSDLFGAGEGRLGPWPGPHKLPIVYNDAYNISFFGLEKLHPFDAQKFRHVVQLLQSSGVLDRAQLVEAQEATLGMLRSVHHAAYLQLLERSPLKVAQVTELALLAVLPACLLRRKVLLPMRLMAGGTVQAGALALQHGWAVNLGGGMHHAWYRDGGGWCAYDDITLLIRKLREATDGAIRRFMVVDLDAHQGNGHERSKLHHRDGDTFIVDIYNCDVYPGDACAAAAIDVAVALPSGTQDDAYLGAVDAALTTAFNRCRPPPDLLIYNAGTDILEGDPLGRFCVTQRGVTQRDAAVFAAALAHKVPVVMLLSGGYTAASTPTIARSLEHLWKLFELSR